MSGLLSLWLAGEDVPYFLEHATCRIHGPVHAYLANGVGLRKRRDRWGLDEVIGPLLIKTRFSAKEATFKAHPSHHLSFHDIVIRSTGAESGPIAAIIRGAEVDFTALVSISHDGGFAMGVCLGCAPSSEKGKPGAELPGKDGE